MANDNVSALLALKAGGGGGSSGSDLFVITLTEAFGVYSADKTFAEVEAAIQAGKICIAKYSNDTAYLVEFDGTTAIFESIAENNVDSYRINDDESCAHYFYPLEKQAQKVSNTISTSITLDLAAANVIYEYGELTALTITAISIPGSFSITFTSGATATVLTTPNAMIMPDGFNVEANTRYEINVQDGYALVAGWAVSSS